MPNIPEAQREALFDLAYHEEDNPGRFAIFKDQSPKSLKPLNLLLRRGFCIRAEYTDRRYGYRITNAGIDYLLKFHSDSFGEVPSE